MAETLRMDFATEYVVEILKLRQASRDISNAEVVDMVEVLKDMQHNEITGITAMITAFAEQVHYEHEDRLMNEQGNQYRRSTKVRV